MISKHFRSNVYSRFKINYFLILFVVINIFDSKLNYLLTLSEEISVLEPTKLLLTHARFVLVSCLNRLLGHPVHFLFLWTSNDRQKTAKNSDCAGKNLYLGLSLWIMILHNPVISQQKSSYWDKRRCEGCKASFINILINIVRYDRSCIYS